MAIQLIEGKTKIIFETDGDPETVLIVAKDDITAGDGAKHDILPGKGAFCTETTCNIFTFLKAKGIPVAFHKQINPTSFSAPKCTMFPYEVVVRREAHGSYLKRHPELSKGHRFDELHSEVFLKTNGKKWKEHHLPCDDPLMLYVPYHQFVLLFLPGKQSTEAFLLLDRREVFSRKHEWELIDQMQEIAKNTFLLLEEAWAKEGRKLVDFKVEFGTTRNGTLLLADEITNDSWRVLEDGVYIDKQVYRDGGELNDVIEKYRRVTEITRRFGS
ncbi:MAG: phosphoribosylaminoimidazolesuccinocarboxamide synthase [Patescibacteria group bacterium]